MINTIFLATGIFLILFGIVSIFFPSLQRFINAPGAGAIKSITCIVVGIILLLIALLIHFPV